MCARRVEPLRRVYRLNPYHTGLFGIAGLGMGDSQESQVELLPTGIVSTVHVKGTRGEALREIATSERCKTVPELCGQVGFVKIADPLRVACSVRLVEGAFSSVERGSACGFVAPGRVSLRLKDRGLRLNGRDAGFRRRASGRTGKINGFGRCAEVRGLMAHRRQNFRAQGTVARSGGQPQRLNHVPLRQTVHADVV